MVACFAAADFALPNGDGLVQIRARRIHNLRVPDGREREFVVLKVYPSSGAVVRKTLATYREAERYFLEEVARHEGEGFVKRSIRFVGFREEGVDV